MPLLKCSASKAKPKNGITYITNPKKAAYVSSRNLFEDEDFAEQFEQTAHRFGKGDKFDERKYYHFKLSCARSDNVTAQQAHRYAQEVAEKLFNDCECVIATHTDTQTVHSHIIVNAVHPITGKKLQFSQKDYVAMKDEVNRIGKEHGFTATEFRKRGKNSRTAPERKIMLNGGTSWKEELREVIVEAIKNSTTPDKFKEYLEKCYGVKITRDGKDYSYLHPEKQKPIRGEKLGTNYTKSEVLRKIGKQNNGEKSGPYNGRRSGFIGQPAGAGVVRGSKTCNGASAGRIVNASIGGIEREMQRLDFDAKCANCGTDAASEERRMAERAAREESEHDLKKFTKDVKESNEKLSRDLNQTLDRITTTVSGIERQVNTATERATDSATKTLNDRVNKAADDAVFKMNQQAQSLTQKVKEAEKEIEKAKDEIAFESGFRKFFFWTTPVLLLVQSVISVLLLLK